MCTICGVNCKDCGFSGQCKGCTATCGNPFGAGCIAAEYIRAGGREQFDAFKKQLMAELNDLCIPGLPKVEELYSLPGFYVNLAYPLPCGNTAELLQANRVYLGTQLPCQFDDGDGERCFGIVCDTSFLLVAEYGANGAEPELVLFKRR